MNVGIMIIATDRKNEQNKQTALKKDAEDISASFLTCKGSNCYFSADTFYQQGTKRPERKFIDSKASLKSG